jgi:hypothetical protein
MRAALVSLSTIGALAAVALGLRHAWPELSKARTPLTGPAAERAAAVHEQLPVMLFDRWKARLRPGQRWWLAVPAGAPEGLTNRGGVYRTYALYWFLPNLPARSEEAADVVFRAGVAR